MTPPGHGSLDAEAGLEFIRARSKRLFGGDYRAEVAPAVSAFGNRQWTAADLAHRLPGVPLSCVNKELSTLLACDLVLRQGKNDRGQFLYSKAGFPEYWAVGRAMADLGAPAGRGATIVPMRKRR